MARGHRIDEVSEVPLVVSDSFASLSKTSAAYATFKKLGVDAEIEKCKDSKKVRAGRGKMRNRRYVMRRGPLVVYAGAADSVTRAIRNFPGVESSHVDR
jgi:large subunit ribosomal protein L4e